MNLRLFIVRANADLVALNSVARENVALAAWTVFVLVNKDFLVGFLFDILLADFLNKLFVELKVLFGDDNLWLFCLCLDFLSFLHKLLKIDSLTGIHLLHRSDKVLFLYGLAGDHQLGMLKLTASKTLAVSKEQKFLAFLR